MPSRRNANVPAGRTPTPIGPGRLCVATAVIQAVISHERYEWVIGCPAAVRFGAYHVGPVADDR